MSRKIIYNIICTIVYSAFYNFIFTVFFLIFFTNQIWADNENIINLPPMFEFLNSDTINIISTSTSLITYFFLIENNGAYYVLLYDESFQERSFNKNINESNPIHNNLFQKLLEENPDLSLNLICAANMGKDRKTNKFKITNFSTSTSQLLKTAIVKLKENFPSSKETLLLLIKILQNKHILSEIDSITWNFFKITYTYKDKKDKNERITIKKIYQQTFPQHILLQIKDQILPCSLIL